MNDNHFISITTLKGVGPKIAALFSQLSILSVQDLLFHLPIRYEDRSKIASISALKSGDRVLVEGVVGAMHRVGSKRYLKCQLHDDTGFSIDLIFYHFVDGYQKKLSRLRDSGIIRCFGEVRMGFSGHLEIVHPEFALASACDEKSELALSPCLLPVYSTTKGLSQSVLRNAMQQALKLMQFEGVLPELLPEFILQENHFLPLNEALSIIHFPPIGTPLSELASGKHPAQQRFIYEELLAHQLGFQRLRQLAQSHRARPLLCDKIQSEKLRAQLPFQLTRAQNRVITEIENDLKQTRPMLRLLQGDVGSGKTIVACFAALHAVNAGFQVALMAPTEIICEQHLKHFSKWLSAFSIRVAILLGKQTASEQAAIKAQLASGEIQCVIGTHALFQDDVIFKHLSLLIIDEQHRFGVHQRLALMEKGLTSHYFPHQLIMSATPIPRTLAMTSYSDLDCSVIDELPPNRKPITTALISNTKRDDVIARLQLHCLSKKQAYWICTLIEESDVLQCQAAETTAHYLQTHLSELNVGLIHGRLPSAEKNALMDAFSQGKIDLLVATTVVEVGVDVANASLMVIENPERLGLAQLHQLRGRVGRGVDASFCVLLYQDPLSETAKKRLSILRETQDGFKIAEMDLEMRGSGDVLGARQAGWMQFQFANLIRDQAMLSSVKKLSERIIQQNLACISLLMKRWIAEDVHYLNA